MIGHRHPATFCDQLRSPGPLSLGRETCCVTTSVSPALAGPLSSPSLLFAFPPSLCLPLPADGVMWAQVSGGPWKRAWKGPQEGWLWGQGPGPGLDSSLIPQQLRADMTLRGPGSPPGRVGSGLPLTPLLVPRGPIRALSPAVLWSACVRGRHVAPLMDLIPRAVWVAEGGPNCPGVQSPPFPAHFFPACRRLSP